MKNKNWKQRQEEKRAKKLMWWSLAIFALSALLCAVSLLFYLNAPQRPFQAPQATEMVRFHLPINHETTLQQKIRNMASEHRIKPTTALRIANCESKTGLMLFNKRSSAKGIYQFTDGTWNAYCEGEVLNTEDNIRCFVELYNAHKNWWKCS